MEKRNLSIMPERNDDINLPQTSRTLDFNKIKVNLQTLEDAVLNDVGTFKKINPNLATKDRVLSAIDNSDYAAMREISDFFFKTSGIYARLCKYMANLYCYDWMITPHILEEKNKEKINEKASKIFYDGLKLLDDFGVKEFLGRAALKVIRHGAYYGYLIPTKDNHVLVQELPSNYCRSRYSVNGRPVVEFNMKYFDEQFKDTVHRLKVIKMFPQDFQHGYALYKEGKLVGEGDDKSQGWYLLEPSCAFLFNNNGEEIPLFINVIPYIIDLDQAQELDRKKMAQKLVKIIIQQLPLDKNGDLLFDIDEAADLHNNAVRMLGKSVGVDVLTTFAEVDVADLADKSSVTSIDELNKVERAVYNESGTAQNLFNTDGNIALEKSILNDEASLTNLILQFERFLNLLVEPLNLKAKKKFYLKVQLLKTTIYNYKELSKHYKELTAMGQSKLLPLIALGQSQSSILANAYFENQVLDLVSLFIPPLTSNTMNAESLDKAKNSGDTKKKNPGEEEAKAGRKEKDDSEKSDKTIANRESMN